MGRKPNVRTPPQTTRARLTTPQLAIFNDGWQPYARFRVAVCGRRFGKTFLQQEELRRACRLAAQRGVDTDNEVWYGAPTLKQAKRVFWRRCKRAIPREWWDGKPNETELSITLKTGHVVRVVGLDNYDDLRGSGLFFFVGDEWADCPPLAWTETIRPMLSTAEGHAIFIGTPKGYDHFYEFWTHGADPTRPDWSSYLYTSVQGGNIPPGEIETAKRELDARSYRQEYEASFETYSGRVIYAFDRRESVRERAFDGSAPVMVGMDFNVNPMTATVWQTDPLTGADHMVGEVVLPTSNTTEMCAELRRRYGRQGFDPLADASVAHITVYPDATGGNKRTAAQGRTDLTILREAGFKVSSTAANPLVRDRINVTNSRFLNADNERRAFVDPSCRKAIEALEKHAYVEGTSDPDKDDGFDHMVDAVGYFMWGKHGRSTSHAIENRMMLK